MVTLNANDARFLDQVADMISRSDGDPPNSEGIWALKLRAIAAAIRKSAAASPQHFGKGGPTVDDPDRPYCKPDQSCCDFCCGN